MPSLSNLLRKPRRNKDTKDLKGHKSSKNSEDSKDSRDSKDSKDSKDSSRPSTGARASRSSLPPRPLSSATTRSFRLGKPAQSVASPAPSRAASAALQSAEKDDSPADATADGPSDAATPTAPVAQAAQAATAGTTTSPDSSSAPSNHPPQMNHSPPPDLAAANSHKPQQQTPAYQSPQNVVSISNIINPPQRDDAHSASQQPATQPAHGQPTDGQADAAVAKPQNHQPRNRGVPRQTKAKYTLADFALRRTLGTGSFGRVHLVQSRHNSRYYAMKVLKKEQVVKMKQVEHTNDERRMLARVKHPFLVTLWGTFQDAKHLYMVMDFVEGGELFSLLRKSQRFPNPVAKFYAAEVVLALEYLHDMNIVYRDLKPENLLLDRHGHLKITDFGFAKEVVDITWTLCGTPDYLAPEVVSSKGYNKSVDW